MMQKIVSIILLGLIVVACVPKRQLDDMKAKYEAEKQKREELATKARKCETSYEELQAEVVENEKRMVALKRDTSVQGKSLRQLTINYDQLNKTYRELLDLKEQIQQGSQAEAKKLLREIESTKTELQSREDELNDLQVSLKNKEEHLNQIKSELEAREQKVKELQSIIDRKDSTSRALRNKLQEALLGFKDKGLTVTMKNGKVYISLENELMFKSGSWDIGSKGEQAIKQLASVLIENTEINIMVEGHTDSDKYYGKGALEDNWDLSVKRATEIVKLLEKFKVESKRLTAAGRGEHVPLDETDTPEAKRKNRRTEIILTPKLDELMNLLESED